MKLREREETWNQGLLDRAGAQSQHIKQSSQELEQQDSSCPVKYLDRPV